MAEQKMTTCKWCKKSMPDDPGAFYHEHACWRADVIRRMDEAEKRGVRDGDAEMDRLQRELFQASYTGD